VLTKKQAVFGLVAVVTLPVLLAACGAVPVDEEPTPAPKSWDNPPAMTIDLNKTYVATFKTENGEIRIELYAKQAPKTVNSFVFLARAGYYDNTTFHRVLAGFMVQGGDLSGTGSGGPGYRFEDEIDSSLVFDGPGILAMANSGPNTNGSQFFITLAPTPWLNGIHTIFGKVVEGMEVLSSISLRDPQTATGPGDVLVTVEIEEKG